MNADDPQKELLITSPEEDATKEDLERTKIKLEIAELRRAWWKKPAYILAAIPTVLAVGSLSIGFLTGYFQATTTKLENQRFLLEQQVKEFEAKREQLHQENAQLLKERDVYKGNLDEMKKELALKEARLLLNSDADVRKRIFELVGRNDKLGKKLGKCMDQEMIAYLFR